MHLLTGISNPPSENKQLTCRQCEYWAKKATKIRKNKKHEAKSQIMYDRERTARTTHTKGSHTEGCEVDEFTQNVKLTISILCNCLHTNPFCKA